MVTIKVYGYQTDKFIHALGFTKSISEAKRLREQGSVEINGTKVTTPYITWSDLWEIDAC